MTKTITVIAYAQAMQGETLVRIYDDATERTFAEEHRELADQYAAYLAAKFAGVPGHGVDLYERELCSAETLDLQELVRQDALAKLSPAEREALGV